MRTIHRDSRLKRVFAAVLMAAVALAVSTAHAQSAAARQTKERVRTALERLQSYGVFDSLAFEVDQNTVTLSGYAYTGSLRSDASRAVTDLAGIEEVGNRIETLPASQYDDQIRWATFYRIYTDPFLSRYAPGGAIGARDEVLRNRRFPGLQPLGDYPIHIVVKGGRTTLVGVVGNESDRTLAEVRAREIFGVFEVKNELEVLSD
jgi:osmotically-inducible protein OsmY